MGFQRRWHAKRGMAAVRRALLLRVKAQRDARHRFHYKATPEHRPRRR